MGITIPEADGGQGGSLMDAVIAIEQVAAVCPRSADVVQFGNFGPIRTFAEYGTRHQKKKWLTECLAGRMVISLGMSEPDAGSAVTDLEDQRPSRTATITSSTAPRCSRPSARRRRCSWSTCATAPASAASARCWSSAARRDSPIGPPQEFMSGEQWSELHFEDCRIPAENVLLGPGGFKKQMASFNVERLGNTARSLAFGRYCYERAREHAAVREQFGRPLCEFQGLQWKFADMAIKLEGAQLLLYRAAANADRGLPSAYETAVAKAACNQVGFEVAHEAVQIMGAAGYSRTSLVEYCMRRCRGWMIAGGSVEMLKNRIAEHVFDRRFDQRPPRRQADAAE